MAPTVGRSVHYYASVEEGPCAATITAVLIDGTVNLAVFHPAGGLVYGRPAVEYSERPCALCWSWPPRSETPPSERPTLPPPG